MSAPHTPGPWDHVDHTVWAVDETGTVNRFSALVQGGYVCRAQGWSTADRTTEDELLANARLIAAAPDLLEALDAVRRVLPETLKQHDLFQAVEDAIAKATGQ